MQKILDAIENGDLITAELEAGRLRQEPGRTPDERSMASLLVAITFFNHDMLAEAETYALRSLQGNFRRDSFCLLGEIAWDRMDYESALGWYEAAAAIVRQPAVPLQGFDEPLARLRVLADKAVKACHPFRLLDAPVTTRHALVVQTLGKRSATRDRMRASLLDAGVDRWPGPKLLIVDGPVEGELFGAGWTVLSSPERQGQAQTYFRALAAAVETGAERLTFFEDDVVFAENALDYIARAEPPADDVAPIVAWWNRMAAPFRLGPPFYFLTPDSAFVRNVALSMSTVTARRLLDSPTVKNWPERHAGDMIYAEALPGAKAALAFPGVVQHIGDESTVGKVEIRKSCSFIGERVDALRLFNFAPDPT